ncbi:MAG: Ribosomal large subunit pseudouridine synthase A [Paracidovorax wautersii]|uniref:Dual-specificity RNA pseudouridine synthase RluA n=1 Tax=Paracidovorax wautersii TaxID=1177982 RepID=A0A7V8JPX1_9BURK|nr:MAG: Ribosomal large subunit pseudouridine synthase A [Paracidovorax wautersii]
MSAPAAPLPPVLFADNHLLAFDKPSGLLSVPGRGPDKQDCLAARARARWPDALVVHRLDMATSGLIVMARGLEMQRRLSAAFADRETAKEYVAVVDGWLASDAGEIALPLITDWPNRPRQMVDHAIGKPSLTRWQVLARSHDGQGHAQTRVALFPVTGRSHQLRVHLQAIGHPILGDALYAPPAALARAPRLLLHACALALPHPATGQPLALRCEPPF